MISCEYRQGEKPLNIFYLKEVIIMARHIAKELKMGSDEAIEGFLKDVKSFKLSNGTKTIEDFHLKNGGIIFLDKNEKPVAFSHGYRTNNMLSIWIIKQYKENGQYSPEQVSVFEDIVYNAWKCHLRIVDRATFVEEDSYIIDDALCDANGCVIEYLNSNIVDVNDISYMVSIEDGVGNKRVHEFSYFEEALDFFDNYKKDLMEERIELIQVLPEQQIILKIETGRLFKDHTHDLELFDDEKE